jgi:hypothetical protein
LLGLFLAIYPFFCLNLIHYKNISLLACIGFQAISKIILQNSLLFPFIAIPLYQQNKKQTFFFNFKNQTNGKQQQHKRD